MIYTPKKVKVILKLELLLLLKKFLALWDTTGEDLKVWNCETSVYLYHPGICAMVWNMHPTDYFHSSVYTLLLRRGCTDTQAWVLQPLSAVNITNALISNKISKNVKVFKASNMANILIGWILHKSASWKFVVLTVMNLHQKNICSSKWQEMDFILPFLASA